MPPHLLRRLPRQPLAYPANRNRAWIRTRRELRFYLRATRVVDGRTHGCSGGVRTLGEELDAAVIAWAEPVAVAENMVRIAPCSEPLPGCEGPLVGQQRTENQDMEQRPTHISFLRS